MQHGLHVHTYIFGCRHTRFKNLHVYTICGGPIIDNLTAILLEETVFIYFCKKNNFKNKFVLLYVYVIIDMNGLNGLAS